jgi:hypothetical protein
MKYIANIITKSKKYKFNDFINVQSSLKNVDLTVPTIVVGTELAKRFLGDDISYIVRKVNDNIFWTYSTTEKRSANEADMEVFKKNIIKTLKDEIKYKYFSVLTSGSYSVIKKIFLIMRKHKDTSILFTDKMFYIAYDSTVIGVSLDECEYIGITREKLVLKLMKYFKNITSIQHLSEKIDINFFENNDILLSAMFCYLNK